MRFRPTMVLAMVAILALTAGVGLALTDQFWDVVSKNTAFRGDVDVAGTFYEGGLVYNASTAAVTGNSLAVSADYNLYVLSATSNQTSVTITNGSLWQEVWFVTAAGSQTFTFDDSTSTPCGTSFTASEGDYDVSRWLCVSSDGDVWACTGLHDN